MKPAKDIETIGVYASESQYVNGPTEEQQASGTVPLDTLPADWWNWLWKEITIRINEAASDVQGLYQEILAILGEANITPDPLLTNQLLVAIQTLIRRVGTEAIAGTVKSSVQSGRVSISADGIMTVNGLGTPSTLNTTSREVVGAINEIHSTLGSHITDVSSTIQALTTGKAPTSHASSGTTYGAGTASLYGHVKLSDTADSSLGVNEGTAITPKALSGAVNGKAPTSHASSGTTYGAGTASLYGHVKLSDTADSSLGVNEGTAITPKALANYVIANLDGKLDKSGGTMTGLLVATKGLRIPTSAPTNPQHGDIWLS